MANPTKLNPPAPSTTVRGDPEQVTIARHLNSTVHHAFGYAYYATGDEAFKRMGDDVFDASYGDQVDSLHCLADSHKAKDYDMNYRASGRYLVWRLSGANGRTLAASGAARPNLPAAASLQSTKLDSAEGIRASLSLAKRLSTSLTNEEQIEGLINQIDNAQRALTAEKHQFISPEDVLKELQAAMQHARTALAAVKAGPGSYETARLRLEWAAARLKRAHDQVQRR